ncbi:cupin domain-containing protein [Frateuria terrea]|uniref:Cupin domain-containing protein n=1 Tax=Frateuria terrea TaxID=529704 RepID=A0A1H6SMP0_9GAMM|nr:cupin domain-containing protein [Frateuria terrea]SEI65260.1 Cupin domain-containing protein [Frateuria terrea]SFP25174.1 Cupin domain-containing protein [Frateuria terrea]
MDTAEVVALLALAQQLPAAWQSRLLGRVGAARIKLARMDRTAAPEEVHDYAEALIVMEGELRLRIAGTTLCLRAGELCLVPAGTAHAVGEGSAGTLLILDT